MVGYPIILIYFEARSFSSTNVSSTMFLNFCRASYYYNRDKEWKISIEIKNVTLYIEFA